MLRATQPFALNDPFECLASFPDEQIRTVLRRRFQAASRLKYPHPDQASNRVERRVLDKKFRQGVKDSCREFIANPHLIREMHMEQYRKYVDQFGVISFSRCWDNALMWAHYAASHTGFCVGYRRDHTVFRTSGGKEMPGPTLGPVQYSEIRPAIAEETMTYATARRVFLTKSIDWAYEQEERLVFLIGDAEVTIPATPFPVALFRVPHEAIDEIIVGLNATSAVVEAVDELKIRYGIKTYKAALSTTKFKLEREVV